MMNHSMAKGFQIKPKFTISFERFLVNHNAMRVFVYVSVTLWPRKWRQQLIKVTGKRTVKKSAHCIAVDQDSLRFSHRGYTTQRWNSAKKV